MITFEEFIKTHIEETEVKTINGLELVFLTCIACSFTRSHKHQMSTYIIGRRVWRQEHFDYVNHPFGKTMSTHHEFPIYEIPQSEKTERISQLRHVSSQPGLFKIPANYKEMSETEQKAVIKDLWLKLVESLEQDKAEG